MPNFGVATSEEAIAEWVDRAAASDQFRADLVTLLPEQHPLYAGRSTNETVRIRGYVLAAFERTGLPPEALPFVMDELQNGRDAYLVAGAAIAVRGGDTAARSVITPFLRKAMWNIRYGDDAITFESYKPHWPVARSTTASNEIRKTLTWLGANENDDGDCCGAHFEPLRATTVITDVDLEDQDGNHVRFAEYFSGKPAVIAFFYTRCDNPNKCSLSISKLARVQEALQGRAKLAAITYDPLYDLPARLLLYGRNRGVRFGDEVRFFRAPGDFDRLRAHFDLGVNYNGAIVNRHRIELFILDRRGNIAGAFTRLQWNADVVLQQIEMLEKKGRGNLVSSAFAAIAAVLVALLPKCPLCVGAYMTALGIGGLQLMRHRPWLVPLSLVFVFLHLLAVQRRARRTGRYASLALSMAGVAGLLAGSVLWTLPTLSMSGAALIVAGSFVSSFRRASIES